MIEGSKPNEPLRTRTIRLVLLVALLLAGEATALGTGTLGRDQNRKGLWDDVESYLYASPEASSELFAAQWQLAAAMQRFMEFGTVPDYTTAVTDELRRGLECAFYVGRLTARSEVEALREKVLSTEGRAKAWMDAEAAARGRPITTTPDPRLWYRSCSGSVRVLPNWPEG